MPINLWLMHRAAEILAVGLSRARSQGGFALPELLVSAIVLALIAAGTVTVLVGTNKAGAQERCAPRLRRSPRPTRRGSDR